MKLRFKSTLWVYTIIIAWPLGLVWLYLKPVGFWLDVLVALFFIDFFVFLVSLLFILFPTKKESEEDLKEIEEEFGNPFDDWTPWGG